MVTVTGDDQVITSADLGQPSGLWKLTVNVGGVEGAYTFELLDNTTTHSGTDLVGSSDTVDVPDITATVDDGDGDPLDLTLRVELFEAVPKNVRESE